MTRDKYERQMIYLHFNLELPDVKSSLCVKRNIFWLLLHPISGYIDSKIYFNFQIYSHVAKGKLSTHQKIRKKFIHLWIRTHNFRFLRQLMIFTLEKSYIFIRISTYLPVFAVVSQQLWNIMVTKIYTIPPYSKQ